MYVLKQEKRGIAMKASKILFIGLMVLGLTTQANTNVPEDKEVPIGINGVYVPSGFTSQSEVYVVASGVFPNSCYSWKKADVEEAQTFFHTVKSFATVKQGMCLMVLVPFQKEIKLGKFSVGEHTLRFENGDGTYLEKKVSIEK